MSGQKLPRLVFKRRVAWGMFVSAYAVVPRIAPEAFLGIVARASTGWWYTYDKLNRQIAIERTRTAAADHLRP